MEKIYIETSIVSNNNRGQTTRNNRGQIIGNNRGNNRGQTTINFQNYKLFGFQQSNFGIHQSRIVRNNWGRVKLYA